MSNFYKTKPNQLRAAKSRLRYYVVDILGYKSEGLKESKMFSIYAEHNNIELPKSKQDKLEWLINEYVCGHNEAFNNAFNKTAYKRKKINIKRKSNKKYRCPYLRKEWIRLRNQWLKLDEYSCKECGSKNNLHVHHIKYNKEDPENYLIVPIEFLLTVCKPCHEKIHGRKLMF